MLEQGAFEMFSPRWSEGAGVCCFVAIVSIRLSRDLRSSLEHRCTYDLTRLWRIPFLFLFLFLIILLPKQHGKAPTSPNEHFLIIYSIYNQSKMVLICSLCSTTHLVSLLKRFLNINVIFVIVAARAAGAG